MLHMMKFWRLFGISASYSRHQSWRTIFSRFSLRDLTKDISRTYSIYTSKETIFSLSSGHGKCGVAVIRISGTRASEALKTLCRYTKLPKPRVATLRTLFDNDEDIPIDHGLILWFPGPFSFTGEDCVEFQVHGGPAVVAAVATALSRIPGCRQAEAGEFTKRAFFNNKLDLTETEGLGDLIHAETEAQRRQALRQMEGTLGKLYNKWRSQIIKMMADVEAFIDFSEDENIEENIISDVNARITSTLTEITDHLNDNRKGERLRSGVRVTILGEPNVGKSSLLNILAQRPAAIVSDVAGTTRDIVESAVNISGYPVLFSDTAGLRESVDVIEREGVRRAIERAKNSDLKVIMLSAPDLDKYIDNGYFDISSYLIRTLQRLGLLESMSDHSTGSCKKDSVEHRDKHNFTKDVLVVINKCDLTKQEENIKYLMEDSGLQICMTSCTDESGISNFLEMLKERLKSLCGNPLVGNPSLTQTRHRQHLSECVGHLQEYMSYIDMNDVVLAAECLRKATKDIGRITGRITSEDILDIIFRDFCIGK